LRHQLATSLAGLHKSHAPILMEHLSALPYRFSLQIGNTCHSFSPSVLLYLLLRNSQMAGKQVEATMLFTHWVQDPEQAFR
jgi:hypothetical protein